MLAGDMSAERTTPEQKLGTFIRIAHERAGGWGRYGGAPLYAFLSLPRECGAIFYRLGERL